MLICAAGVLVLATTAWTQSAEKAIAAQEQQWLQAQKTNNPDLLAPLLADTFINTSMEGNVTNKSGTLATYKNTKWESGTWLKMPTGQMAVRGQSRIANSEVSGCAPRVAACDPANAPDF